MFGSHRNPQKITLQMVITDFGYCSLMGQVAGLIQKIQPAKEIVDEMVAEATTMLKLGGTYLNNGATSSKL